MTIEIPRTESWKDGNGPVRRLTAEQAAELGPVSKNFGADSKGKKWQAKYAGRLMDVHPATEEQIAAVRKDLKRRTRATQYTRPVTVARHTEMEVGEATTCCEILVERGDAAVYRHGNGGNTYRFTGAK